VVPESPPEGSLITKAAIRFTSNAVDTNPLVADVSLIPGALSPNNAIQILGTPVIDSGVPIAWWQLEGGDVGSSFAPDLPTRTLSRRIRIRNTGGGTINDFNFGNSNLNHTLSFLRETSSNTGTGEKVTIENDGTLGFCTFNLARVGTITGDPEPVVRVEVYSGSGPSKTLLATSDTIVAQNIPTAQTGIVFTFSDGDQISLLEGQERYFVLRGNWAPIAVNGYINTYGSVLDSPNSTSDGPVFGPGVSGGFYGSRYMQVPMFHFHTPHSTITSDKVDQPHGSIDREVTVPSFTSSGATFDMEFHPGILQEWISSPSYTDVPNDYGEKLAVHLYVPEQDFDDVDGNERDFDDIELVISYRDPRAFSWVPRGMTT
jgi:hypothetical protein